MPKSKSKRDRYVPPPQPRPKPSPKWIPYVVFTCFGVGFSMIMARYLFSTIYPALDNNWYLGGGLGLVAVGFSIATQWR